MEQEKNFEIKRTQLIKDIEEAFKNVELGDGIGPNEAFAIDERLEENSLEYKDFKAKDERHNWKKVIFYPTEESNGSKYFSMREGADSNNNIDYTHWRSFSDVAGKRFSFAPYMIYILLQRDFSNVPDLLGLDIGEISFIINDDEEEYSDHFKKQYSELFASFSRNQKNIIKNFVDFDIELGKHRSNLLENEEYINDIETKLYNNFKAKCGIENWIIEKKQNVIDFIKRKENEKKIIEELSK
ncbi:hypothetical protein P148_SR1C00001G0695 [candidate division SR1 bacterium RAAC1_SR1_1]|nr:hypothetical protein P148_SR1C00001G0695 [candidate division SR1 bacterium RAAC1_SR1_1]